MLDISFSAFSEKERNITVKKAPILEVNTIIGGGSLREQVAVVGAGMVGCVQALLLAEMGLEVTVFEKRADPLLENYQEGKSINLAVSDRGFKTLEILGLDQAVRDLSIPMRGRMIHPEKGESYMLPYGKEGQAIHSISRHALNAFLIEKARAHPGINFKFKNRCVDLKIPGNEMKFLSQDKTTLTTYKFDRIFGTDGAYSSIRSRLQKINRFNYQQSFLEHGYKELQIPAKKGGGFLLEENALHIWPRGEYMLIALPNADGSFTCTLFLPFEGDHSFEALKTEEDLERFFNYHFPGFAKLVPDLTDQFFRNHASSLVTIQCSPWNYKDEVLLLGDAAHGMVPFYGQGMNCGLEDLRVLYEMSKGKSNWDGLFQEFCSNRKPDTDAISQLALDNFDEMCSKTQDEKFVLRKKIESLLAEKFPQDWIPLYTRVTFSQRPYREAAEFGKIHDDIMDQVLQMDDIENRWDSQKVLDFAINLLYEKVACTS